MWIRWYKAKYVFIKDNIIQGLFMTPPPPTLLQAPLYTFSTFFIYIDILKDNISGTLISSLLKKCTAFSGNNNNHSSPFLQKFQITNILKSRVNDVYISKSRC